MLIIILASCPVYVLAAIFIYAVSATKPAGAELAVFMTLFGVAAFASGFAYAYFKAFAVSIAPDGDLSIQTLFGKSVIPLSSVVRVDVVTGTRGGDTVAAFDVNGRRLFRIPGTVEGSASLISAISRNAKRLAIPIKRRDMFGRWTQA